MIWNLLVRQGTRIKYSFVVQTGEIDILVARKKIGVDILALTL